ncbi:uncharacterized protein LOC110466932 [Mizuhopecten yessoensis]|uniref:uncharacterized protein LOC110441899 n=1 Tax=Mizuhopecten yessoensis TaxID=6573 RepID=UPI000B45ED8C|nr:uncharacterized protein LOC110441899 [Mizuhopecten yessoensis]XP_021379412.1 uncharacterized protein LOC110466932 [Mizuhopecten yessoensis]
MSLRPKTGKCSALYLRPKKTPSPDCWYCDSPLGVHILQQTVGKLCEEAGFKGYFTNHSLRATAATRLYKAGFDEQLVAEKTGHRSAAIRSYKRTCDAQLANVSSVVQGIENMASPVKKLKLADSSNTNTNNRELSVSAGEVSFTLRF